MEMVTAQTLALAIHRFIAMSVAGGNLPPESPIISREEQEKAGIKIPDHRTYRSIDLFVNPEPDDPLAKMLSGDCCVLRIMVRKVDEEGNELAESEMEAMKIPGGGTLPGGHLHGTESPGDRYDKAYRKELARQRSKLWVPSQEE